MTVKKLNTSITKGLQDSLKEFSRIDRRTATKIGGAVVNEMRSLSKRGISPIGRGGRFPGYKAAGLPAKERRNKYPFNQRSKFPGKRARPVNLFLSGKFLKSLRFDIVSIGVKLRIRVGFTGKLSAAKEQGHRDGANGQPKRPIIPGKTEQFSRKVQQVIIRIFQNSLRKKVLKAK